MRQCTTASHTAIRSHPTTSNALEKQQHQPSARDACQTGVCQAWAMTTGPAVGCMLRAGAYHLLVRMYANAAHLAPISQTSTGSSRATMPNVRGRQVPSSGGGRAVKDCWAHCKQALARLLACLGCMLAITSRLDQLLFESLLPMPGPPTSI